MDIRRALMILPAVTLAAVLGACAAGKIASAPGTTTTIILIRHAEKQPTGPVDGSHLLPEGRARALALADALADKGVTAIYSPNLGRNIETVQPLAERLGIEITVKEGLSMFGVDELAHEMLARHPGGVVLFVGNVSGNLMALHRYLGGEGRGPVNYGDMAIFRISERGTESVTFSRF